MSDIAIHWFRQDLRLSDNPAFIKACESGAVLPIYILDDDTAGKAKMGGASRWWLYHSLKSLNDSLKGHLRLYKGKAADILPNLQNIYGAKTITWTRCYEPWRRQRDEALKEQLKQKGVTVISQNGSLLWEPWQVLKADNTPYKVFTPFYRKGCLQSAPAPAEPVAPPADMVFAKALQEEAIELEQLDLLPKPPIPDWHLSLEPHWSIGESAAQKRARDFFETGLQGYKMGRDFPALSHISKLSAHLHFGEISPNQLWYWAKEAAQIMQDKGQTIDADIDHFCSEIAWREFSYSLLFYHPDLPDTPLQKSFEAFPWQQNDVALLAWQMGQTGIPIVDAAMRQLWQTGFMHNRLRMVAASFLIKNLRIDWRIGEAWFWDCLVDADLAANSASWQWVAGCGADAAPYFRVFNPVLQGEKFDKDGTFTRQFVPELAKLPNKYLFKPWEAPSAIIQDCGIQLGKTYPLPIVDLKRSRQQALEAYEICKSTAFAQSEHK
ncbi:MAG: DNA photolyase family protein [Cohaesibacter sp.]|nr:DNA photolyase family protein [Cohaesibacter sp.]